MCRDLKLGFKNPRKKENKIQTLILLHNKRKERKKMKEREKG
jgi:hypothetical protein